MICFNWCSLHAIPSLLITITCTHWLFTLQFVYDYRNMAVQEIPNLLPGETAIVHCIFVDFNKAFDPIYLSQCGTNFHSKACHICLFVALAWESCENTYLLFVLTCRQSYSIFQLVLKMFFNAKKCFFQRLILYLSIAALCTCIMYIMVSTLTE